MGKSFLIPKAKRCVDIYENRVKWYYGAGFRAMRWPGTARELEFILS